MFYTTGRLTSEMVIKSAQMGVAIVVSRSGITQMGHEVAHGSALCAIGRATNRRFLCYAGVDGWCFSPSWPARRAPTAAYELSISWPVEIRLRFGGGGRSAIVGAP